MKKIYRLIGDVFLKISSKIEEKATRPSLLNKFKRTPVGKYLRRWYDAVLRNVDDLKYYANNSFRDLAKWFSMKGKGLRKYAGKTAKSSKKTPASFERSLTVVKNWLTGSAAATKSSKMIEIQRAVIPRLKSLFHSKFGRLAMSAGISAVIVEELTEHLFAHWLGYTDSDDIPQDQKDLAANSEKVLTLLGSAYHGVAEDGPIGLASGYDLTRDVAFNKFTDIVIGNAARGTNDLLSDEVRYLGDENTLQLKIQLYIRRYAEAIKAMCDATHVPSLSKLNALSALVSDVDFVVPSRGIEILLEKYRHNEVVKDQLDGIFTSVQSAISTSRAAAMRDAFSSLTENDVFTESKLSFYSALEDPDNLRHVVDVMITSDLTATPLESMLAFYQLWTISGDKDDDESAFMSYASTVSDRGDSFINYLNSTTNYNII